jgi:hypothetical protein
MYNVWGKAFIVAVFIVVLGQLWGCGGPPITTVSDSQRNTAGGTAALQSNTGGANNTAIGVDALSSNTNGDNNTAVGFRALEENTSGSGNTAIGEGAGENLISGVDNIYLGSPGVTTESNTMRLGADGTHTRTFIAGVTGTPLNGSTVVIDAAGQLGLLASSARYKRDIHDMGERSRGVVQLRPVTFRYTQDPQGVLQYGLIAEEVAAVYPELVVRGPEETVESVQYHGLIPLLLNELQHQQQALVGQARQLTAQSQQLAELKGQNERLQLALVQQNAELAARLARLEEATAPPTTSASR